MTNVVWLTEIDGNFNFDEKSQFRFVIHKQAQGDCYKLQFCQKKMLKETYIDLCQTTTLFNSNNTSKRTQQAKEKSRFELCSAVMQTSLHKLFYNKFISTHICEYLTKIFEDMYIRQPLEGTQSVYAYLYSCISEIEAGITPVNQHFDPVLLEYFGKSAIKMFYYWLVFEYAYLYQTPPYEDGESYTEQYVEFIKNKSLGDLLGDRTLKQKTLFQYGLVKSDNKDEVVSLFKYILQGRMDEMEELFLEDPLDDYEEYKNDPYFIQESPFDSENRGRHFFEVKHTQQNGLSKQPLNSAQSTNDLKNAIYLKAKKALLSIPGDKMVTIVGSDDGAPLFVDVDRYGTIGYEQHHEAVMARVLLSGTEVPVRLASGQVVDGVASVWIRQFIDSPAVDKDQLTKYMPSFSAEYAQDAVSASWVALMAFIVTKHGVFAMSADQVEEATQGQGGENVLFKDVEEFWPKQ